MVFRQGDCCIALAAGAVPIQLQPIVVRGLGDVHMYYVLNPAVVAEVQAPRAGAPQAAEHAPLGDRPAPAAAVARQAGQLAAPGRHARPLLTPPPPLMRLQGAEAGPVRGLAAGHVTAKPPAKRAAAEEQTGAVHEAQSSHAGSNVRPRDASPPARRPGLCMAVMHFTSAHWENPSDAATSLARVLKLSINAGRMEHAARILRELNAAGGGSPRDFTPSTVIAHANCPASLENILQCLQRGKTH